MSSSHVPHVPNDYYASAATAVDNGTSAVLPHSHHHYRMERVLYNLHYQLCTGALRRTSRRTRTLVEHGVLVLSVCCFGVLLLVHWSFVYRGGGSATTSSMDSLQRLTAEELFITKNTAPLISNPTTTPASFANPFNDARRTPSRSYSSGGAGGPRRCLSSVPGFRNDADITHLSLLKVRRFQSGNGTTSLNGVNDGEQVDEGVRLPNRRRQPGSSYAYIEDWGGISSIAECQVRSTSRVPDPASNDEERQCRLGNDNEAEAAPRVDETSTSPIYYSYSRVKGYLLLPPELCQLRNLTVQHVVVSPDDTNCFGEPFLRHLVFGVTGVDTVMINWFLEWDGPTGFLLNPRIDPANVLDLESLYSAEAGIVLRHRSSRWRKRKHWNQRGRKPVREDSRTDSDDAGTSTSTSMVRQLLSKLAVVAKTSFLFFIITTLVSFTLRETQERMIDFTHQLRELYAHGDDGDNNNNDADAAGAQSRPPNIPASILRSIVPSVPRVNWHVVPLVIRHLAENLLFVPIMIGMIFFLIEFYRGDKFLAFMVVSLVWLCEVFTVISLRSSQGLHFFPRIFFLLFSLFHFYLFLYPFGFCYTALASTALFMMHSMLFFWHRYELPAVAHGHVTLDNPRMGPWPTSHHHNSTRSNWNDSDPSRAHSSAPYGPTPPGIPNILLPARRTSTPSLLRHPIHNSLVHASPSSRTPAAVFVRSDHGAAATTAAVAAEAHPVYVVVEGSHGGDNMSRPTSSVALVRDDDSSSSYLYFMDGEVVLHSSQSQSHRDSRFRPPMQRAGSFPSRFPEARASGSTNSTNGYDSLLRQEQFHRTFSDNDEYDVAGSNSRSSLQSVMGNVHRVLDDRSLLAALEPPETTRVQRRELFVQSHDEPDADSSSSYYPNGSADPPEISSLQAILFRGSSDEQQQQTSSNVSSTQGTTAPTTNPSTASSTPRADNRSSLRLDAQDGVASSASDLNATSRSAPSVPLLRNRRKAAGGQGSVGSGGP